MLVEVLARRVCFDKGRDTTPALQRYVDLSTTLTVSDRVFPKHLRIGGVPSEMIQHRSDDLEFRGFFIAGSVRFLDRLKDIA